MKDKTLGEYKRTTPDPDETTGEALARLQAEFTRLLDEADAELRDDMDGGVAAALIEKEAEQPAAEVRELRSALAREIARGNALQDALDAAPDALTAREHLDAAWEAAHVPADGIIPARTPFLFRSAHGGSNRVSMSLGAPDELPVNATIGERRLLDPPAPARSKAVEDIVALLDDYGMDNFEERDLLAEWMAERGVRVGGEDR